MPKIKYFENDNESFLLIDDRQVAYKSEEGLEYIKAKMSLII